MYIDQKRTASPAPTNTAEMPELSANAQGYFSQAWAAISAFKDAFTRPVEETQAPLQAVYITGGAGSIGHPKIGEVTHVLAKHGVNLRCVAMPDLPTLSCGTLEDVALFRLDEARRRLVSKMGDGSDAVHPARVVVFLDEMNMLIDGHKGNYPGRAFKPALEGLGTSEFARREEGRKVEIRIVLAAGLADGSPMRVYDGTVSGTIVSPPRAPEGAIEGEHYAGYDSFVVPSGYKHTVAELSPRDGSLRLSVSPRLFATLSMRSDYFGDHFKGVYELHITIKNVVQNAGESDADFAEREAQQEADFREACDRLKVGAIAVRNLIQNADGSRSEALQLQTKGYHALNSSMLATKKIFEMGQKFVALDNSFEPIRWRVEAMSRNPDAPRTDLEAQNCDPNNYFEFHLKVANPDGTTLSKENLEYLAAQVQHISGEHPLRFSKVGEKYFINGKYYGVGLDTATAHWDVLMGAVKERNLKYKEIPKEYCIGEWGEHLDEQWNVLTPQTL